MQTTSRRVRVVVIGAGLSGIAMAIRLQRAGYGPDMTIIDQAAEFGGTWRDNTYPGCACDVPSHLYSLVDEPYDWPRLYAHQPVIQDYILDVVRRHGLNRRARLGTTVTTQEWDARSATWTLTLADGDSLEAEVVINAIGPLSRPVMPDIPGAETFAGPSFHSAQWPADLHLGDLRLGIIGTGASAVQIVPAVADPAGHVTVFQRTPSWVLPRPELTFTPGQRVILRRVPGAARVLRWLIYMTVERLVWPILAQGRGAQARAVRSGRWNIRHGITDPDLRIAVTPDLVPGCKRMMFSNTYYPALDRDDVTLETRSIRRVLPGGVQHEDGAVTELDVLVYGTGFDPHQFWLPMQVIGQDGVRLRDAWHDGGKAYLGTTAPSFPNMFFLLGPNTGTGHNSVVLMAEAQADYVMGALEYLRSGAVSWLAPTEASADSYADEMAHRHEDLVWASGCGSWYLNEGGVNDTIYPGPVRDFQRRLGRFDIEAYQTGRPVQSDAHDDRDDDNRADNALSAPT